MERVRALVVAVIGPIAVLGAARWARRLTVVDRLRGPEPRLRIPAGVRTRIAGALDAAAISRSVDEALHTWLLAGAIAGLLGFGFAGTPTAVAGVVCVLVGAPLLVVSARGRRARLVAAGVPNAVDRVAAELRAGGTVATAIVTVAEGDDPLAGDFARIHARLRVGSSLDAALRCWTTERAVEGVGAVAGALAVCASAGGRSADALDGLSSSLRDHLAVVAEAQALSAQARLSAVVVASVPIAYLAWSMLVDPHALHVLFATSIGRVCVALGLGLEALGGWWMRRIIRAGSVL
jgi:tight adherence protein B